MKFSNDGTHLVDQIKVSDENVFTWANKPAASEYTGRAWFSDIVDMGYSDGTAWYRVPDNIENSDSRIASIAKMTSGVRVNIGTATLSHANSSNLKAVATVFDVEQSISGKSIQLPYHASGAYVDVTVSLVFTAANGALGFWLYKPPIKTGTTPSGLSAITVYLTNNGFSTFCRSGLLVRPGLHFYSIPVILGDGTAAENMLATGTNPTLNGGIITTIRIKNTDSTFTGGSYSALPASETIEIGDIFQIVPPKAKFIFCYDDCKLDLLHPASGTVAGYDGITKAHSYLSFLKTYGWRVSCYAISGAVGGRPINTRNFLTVNELKEAQSQYGAIICNHSKSHPSASDVSGAATNRGMMLLGPYGYTLTSGATFVSDVTGLTLQPTNDYTAIYNDIVAASEQFLKWGFPSAAEHFAIPQGSVDKYVNEALDKCGFKTVRGIENAFCPANTDSTCSTIGWELQSSAINLRSSVQTDQTSASDSVFHTYVDNIIAAGGIGTNYCHSFGTNAPSMTQTKALADYLKIKELAGLIDVITVDDLI